MIPYGRVWNPKDKDYKNYGARGILVDDSWKSFSKFVEDMGFPGVDSHTNQRLTLDRLDNDKGYCKDNCRWTTKKNKIQTDVNQRNKLKLQSQ